ncbi:MAG: hypothetical protein K0R12_630 [Gammaproteobacteria bacterium]|jgi:AmmeMemoRadiSam system protein B/AmmeMemoRadiSam system protein A|nr:hypothetical protein [Gammaproteobacteria bacterium]
MEKIRHAAVSGQFYPADPRALKKMVNECLNKTLSHAKTPKILPKAIIAPHAGFIYSGDIAANAYAYLSALKKQIKKVVLLGPAHTVALHGIAASSASHYETPLGKVAVDANLQQKALALPQVQIIDDAHAREHSLEVQLPFLQVLLEGFTFIPLVVGNAMPDKVAEVLEKLWGGDETLVVISSDLSHYHPYEIAINKDKQTSEAILEMRYQDIAFDSACGRNPIKGLLYLAQQKGLEGCVLDLRNSGDTASDKSRVVGYGAYHFFPLQHYQTAYGKALLQLARKAIDFTFKEKQMPHVQLSSVPAILQKPKATFVTITINNQLRGCIGSLQAVRPLAEDIVHNAFHAAFHDPRFTPLTPAEWEKAGLSISILSDPIPIDCQDEASLLNALKPEVDGLILQCSDHQATFLPSVWEALPDPKVFLSRLKQKAGLAPDFWSKEMKALRYTAEIIK